MTGNRPAAKAKKARTSANGGGERTERRIPQARFGRKLDPNNRPDSEEDNDDESFLLDQPAERQGKKGRRLAPSRDDQGETADDDWYSSDVEELIAQPGSEDLPGNWRIGVPMWVLHYFGNTERAVLFAQILYWFGRTAVRRHRANRRGGGRSVVDKTHQELANEIGLKNKRKIEGHLKVFKEKGLLDYRTIGYGRGRTTRMRLLPAGVLKAYSVGCERVEEVKDD